jgi:hypothetical protein
MGPYGEMVYELDAPTSAALIGGPSTVLPGAGPNGADAYYRPGNTGGGDDSSQYYWDFSFANLPNVGQDLVPGEYQAEVYVSDYGGLPHEDNGVFGSPNGPWGWHAMENFSSWDGYAQGTPGWVKASAWVGGYVWLSNDGWSNGIYTDTTVSCKWNPWGGYGGLAVSGVRVSKAIPEPSSILALLAGFPALALLRRRR